MTRSHDVDGGPLRIGILGGTFNPVHMGHLVAAEEVGKDFDLEKVLLIPTNQPPLKEHEGVISAEHRLRMVTLAAAHNPRLEARDLEIRRGGVSYTVDTLRALTEEFGPAAEFFFILGQDAFRSIGSWRDAPELFRMTHFVVVRRPTLSVDEMIALLEETVTARFGEPAFSRTGFDNQAMAEGLRVEPSGRRIWLKDIPYFHVSSTMLRKRLAAGRSIKYLVPEAVETYILEHLLYAVALGREVAKP
ncbi:MAG: nicotinate-nucleotide adenylyltransferase [Candidatus Tectomicrobia bacterium]|nr:nicotinate-nucleotide adenylyltransferase [Candidatus Tectomicrobia bacterium]